MVLGVTAVLFAIAMAAFTRVPQQFSRIRAARTARRHALAGRRLVRGATLREAKRLEKALDGRPEIDHVVDFVAFSAPRFYLPLDQQLQQPNFAQFVITAKDVETRDRLSHWLESTLASRFPTVRTRVARGSKGPPVGFPIKFRVSGDDIAAVRGIAEKVADKVRADARTRNVQFDWDEPAERSVSFEIDQLKARQLGVTSEDVSGLSRDDPVRLHRHAVSRARQAHRRRSARAEERTDRSVEALRTQAVPTPHGPCRSARSATCATRSNTA